MSEAANALSAWESFYVIVGSSGAALVGIQFVVITLVADRREHAIEETLSAFATPTIVHFSGALTISAIMSAPWRSPLIPSLVLQVLGIAGLTYGAMIIRRALHQTAYAPVWQDWVWYAAVPCCIYAALTIAAISLRGSSQIALFVIGAAALSLLLTGIHNAWDSVTHLVARESRGEATAPSTEAQDSTESRS